MEALVVVDVQNEFSADGKRPVPNHQSALKKILEQVQAVRQNKGAIAWVRHSNKPEESPAFVPGSWGSQFSPGIGPEDGFGREKLFEKDVFGAFTGTSLEEWLRAEGCDSILIVGFYTHMCVSTSTREALVRGFHVRVDSQATGACALEDERLGKQTADEVRRSALLHLAGMGASIV
jgi:nicotinamidase-related amidase